VSTVARGHRRQSSRRVRARRLKFHRPLEGKKFIITSAQNATLVEDAVWDCLVAASKAMNATLVVIPLRYKNPTSLWSTKQQDEEWWDPKVVPYLFTERKKLGDNLVLCADVKVQPTAGKPLGGFEGLTGKESCIIGHPKMQFKTVAAPTGRFPKILTTTGCCTKKNYTDSKAGKKGAFHHYFGGIIVELVGKKFHLRQANVDPLAGYFIDLDKMYTRKGVQKAPRALAVVFGDWHARFTDRKVDRATFGPRGIVETINPIDQVWHDTNDNYAANHHHKDDPFISIAKMRSGYGNVEGELRYTYESVRKRTTKGRRSVLVMSNHDDFLRRWIAATDWRKAPNNAEFYLKTALAMAEGTRMGKGGSETPEPFAMWIDRLKGGAKDIVCQPADKTLTIGGIECALHGDKGPDGSRGTLDNLSRLGCRVISGHRHSPGIEEGHYQVGTSTPLKLEYTHGPSSWLNTHCVVYANGKRALITIIDGEWRRRGR
jgi:hypothetical protein